MAISTSAAGIQRTVGRPQLTSAASSTAVADEGSPSLVEYEDGRRELYFSSNRAGGYAPEAPGATSGDSDIYVSEVADDGALAAPVLVDGVNSAVNDSRPNVRRDGREIFFDSNRTGGFGGLDVWSSVRAARSDPWPLPFNVGPGVNSSANETRPFLSWGGTTLYFGTNRAGVEVTSPPPAVVLQDIFVTTRVKQH